jgi:uncharacterized protein YidB (DUF937 family)
MGLFDDLAGGGLGTLLGGGTGKSTVVDSILGMLNNQQAGGLEGFVKNLTQRGLSEIVNSWVGTGANLPITPEQIQQALGSEKVQELANKAGLSTSEISSHLAELLPTIVDKLTPNGSIPQGDLLQNALGFLKSKL